MYLASRYVAPTHSIHYRKRHKYYQSSNATIPDPQHTSRGLSIYRGSVCLMSPTHMPNKHIMWYLLDTQHILQTHIFLTYDATFSWSPARVSRIPIYRGFVHHPPTAYTMGKAPYPDGVYTPVWSVHSKATLLPLPLECTLQPHSEYHRCTLGCHSMDLVKLLTNRNTLQCHFKCTPDATTIT